MHVIAADSVDKAMTAIRDAAPDVVVTDNIHVDDALAAGWRRLLVAGTPPVIVIAESNHAGVECFEAGAADYVVDPFTSEELQARTLARMRTSPRRVIDCADLRIDRAGRRVTVRGMPVDLTPREFELLAFLAAHPLRVFSRDQLLGAVWGSSSNEQDPGTLTEHVYRIRQKIDEDPKRPRWIKTVHGVGYRFDP